MFSCRLLFRNTFITVDKLPVSCKCTVNGKTPNVIKVFNTENKSLFGSLLESKTERRKSVTKATVNPSVPLVTETSTATDFKDQDQTGASKKKKSRSKKTKDIEAHTVLSDNSQLTDNSCVEGLKTDVSKKTINELNRSQNSAKLKSRKTSSSDFALSNNQDVKDEESSVFSSDKSFLKPAVSVNENSYSLENPDKFSNSGLAQDSQNEKQVLSDKFILKSTLPVNENIYPLDNPDKLDVSTTSYNLETILNYGFTDPLVKGYMGFPSVSKIMEDTMSPTSRMVLGKWRKNMVAELGEDGFVKHCTALKERGHDFHEAVRNAVLGCSSKGCHSDVIRNALRSLEWVLSHVTNPMAVESIIAHPHLQYKGIPDCVAMFRGLPVVIDWKLSEKPKKNLKDTYDAPVQITAYMGALNHDPNYKWKVSHGLVAVAYTSGDPCDVFLLAPKHCEIYWRHWLLRFHKFKARSHLHVDHQIDEKALESV